MLDNLIGIFSPKAAFERAAWRQARQEIASGVRGYDAAARGRTTADWRAGAGSADREIVSDLATLRNRTRQMVRDNGYVASAVRNLTANIVGTGIEACAQHADPKIAALAQSVFADAAAEPMDVEGLHDLYAIQKLNVRGMIEGGDTLTHWRPEGREPDRRVLLLEGDQLDGAQTRQLENGGRVVAGVEYDAEGRRVAYHVLDHHPGDQIAWLGTTSRRVPAQDVDHLFESVRIGQSRGVPWLHAGLRKVRDVSETEEAIRIKKRIEACLSVFRKAGEQGAPSPLGQQTAQAEGPAWERLAPGMVITGKPGEEIQVINPSSTGDGDAFLRGQLTAVAASFGLPYHVMTGDVSQANYSSLRASMVAFWALLDDWVYNTVVPRQCNPAFRRIMRREAVKRNEPKLLQVRATWTPPKRSWVDPLKDITAEIMEARAFPGGLAEAMAARGRDLRSALNDQAEVYKLIDELGLALDSDPRRVNGSGGLQPAAGYLRPKAAE